MPDTITRLNRKSNNLCDCCGGPRIDSKARCPSCRSKLAENRKSDRLRRKSAGLCYNCNEPAQSGGYCESCKKKKNDAVKIWTEKLRLEVLQHYSGGTPKCACCGETEIRFLSIDHINGGGIEHRKRINGSIYLWLRRNNYPEGYRILCHNCNFSYGLYGNCPHQKF